MVHGGGRRRGIARTQSASHYQELLLVPSRVVSGRRTQWGSRCSARPRESKRSPSSHAAPSSIPANSTPKQNRGPPSAGAHTSRLPSPAVDHIEGSEAGKIKNNTVLFQTCCRPNLHPTTDMTLANQARWVTIARNPYVACFRPLDKELSPSPPRTTRAYAACRSVGGRRPD